MGTTCHATKTPKPPKTEIIDEGDPQTRPKSLTVPTRKKQTPRLSYQNSIPIDRLSPHKLSQPPLKVLKLQTKYEFSEQEAGEKKKLKPKGKGKKKRKKKGNKPRKKSMIPALYTPSLKNLDEIGKTAAVDIVELKSPLKLGSPRKKREGGGENNGIHQKAALKPAEKVLNDPDPEEEGQEFLEFELNDKEEAQDFRDLIEAEIRKIEEQKEQIAELETHMTKDINVIFEPEEAVKVAKKSSDGDMLFSLFREFHVTKTISPNPKAKQENKEFSIVHETIKQRLEELEKRKNGLTDFRQMIAECIDKEAKLLDDDYANVLEGRFNELRAEHEFLNVYKGIKDEDKDAKSGISKLVASIMNERSMVEDSKRSLQKIRGHFEKKSQGFSKEDVRKAKDGLRQELTEMMNSMRASLMTKN